MHAPPGLSANVRPLPVSDLDLAMEMRTLRDLVDRLTAHLPIASQDTTDETQARSPRVTAVRKYRLILALAWLLAVAFPVAETQLPMTEQTLITYELATVTIALALTWRAIDGHKK